MEYFNHRDGRVNDHEEDGRKDCHRGHCGIVLGKSRRQEGGFLGETTGKKRIRGAGSRKLLKDKTGIIWPKKEKCENRCQLNRSVSLGRGRTSRRTIVGLIEEGHIFVEKYRN